MEIRQNEESKEFELVPKERIIGATIMTDSPIGTGWSMRESAEEAVKEADAMALEAKRDRKPAQAL